MTYQEIKDKLTQCEVSLEKIKASSIKRPLPATKLAQANKLQLLKEELTKRLLEAESKTYLVTPKKGQTTAVSLGDDEKDALKDADDVKAIKGVDGEEVKERLDKNTGTVYSVEETKTIAKRVGKATAKALKDLGDQLSTMKALHIEENSFEIYVEYKKDNSDDTFSFHVINDNLHLADFSFNKVVCQIGTKPSGEPIVNIDVLSNNLKKHWNSMAEDYDPDQEQKDDEEDHGVGYDDEGRPLGEGEGDDHHYIKVPNADYKKAQAILDQNIDPTYVKMEVVDNDGAGNVIFYFVFKHEDGFDDMYDDSGDTDSEFYQEPDEDPQAFIYDAAMDLRANDITVSDSSADLDEATDINDPVMLKVRRAKMHSDKMKKLDAYSKSPEGKAAVRAQASGERKEQKAREIVRKLKIKRAEVEREMENDPGTEPQGGPVSDMYGDQLNKIDNAIEKAASVYNKPMDYDTAVGKVNEGDGDLVTFGYDLDMIQQVVDHLQKKYKEGDDFELHIGRGDDLPNAVTLKNPALQKDYDLNDMLNAAQSDEDRYDAYTDGEDTDYAKRRKEGDDYYEDPDYYKEGAEHPEGGPDQGGDLDVGHQDDEPNMLQKDLYDIAHYAAKLHQRLKKYDAHDGEVDFPHWWQKKVTLAREYISSAQHYLESEENQPAMDQLALESVVKEGRGDLETIIGVITDMSNEDGTTPKEAALEVIEAIRDHYIIDAYDEGVVNEESAAKVQKAYSKVVSIMKDLAKKYKEGDKSVVDQLKTLTITKKELEKRLDRAVAGTHHSQELDEKNINEYASRDLDEIFGALGYRQGFDEFIEDNPGCVEVIMEWIGSIRDFQQKLSDEYSKEELENLGFYYGDDDDEYNESLDESLNPEVSKKVAQFIKAMAKRYDYSEQDAVYAIMAALKQRDFDGVNEFDDKSMKAYGDAVKAASRGKHQGTNYKWPMSKATKDRKEADKKQPLKEFTDNSFKGSEVIDDANERGPDMFGKGIFADLLPKGVASENDAVEALKAHDKSPIKARMGRYAPMFVHVQYHELEHEGKDYRMHQTQYYNSNFKDKDPNFNPGVSKLSLIKLDPSGDRDKEVDMGSILVKTDDYIRDLKNLNITKRQS